MFINEILRFRTFRQKQRRLLTKLSNTFLDMKIRRLRKTKKVYQPAFLPELNWNYEMSPSKEISLALQISQITSRIGERESTIDIGSNLGYITLNLGRQFPNSVVWGLEPDKDLVEAANRSAEKASLKNVKFQELEVNNLNIEAIPDFDNTIFLSVFQQWVRAYGLSQSQQMLKTIIRKTKKKFFFSMATTNGSPKIREYFPDMGQTLEESDKWIVDNLFTGSDYNIDILGRFETTYGSSLPRTLFLLTKK